MRVDGFSLIETLVASALLAITLVFTLQLVHLQRLELIRAFQYQKAQRLLDSAKSVVELLQLSSSGGGQGIPSQLSSRNCSTQSSQGSWLPICQMLVSNPNDPLSLEQLQLQFNLLPDAITITAQWMNSASHLQSASENFLSVSVPVYE
ncbi:prepilin-type N-terminal cleavage/methylation domain-containing protein [Celerinatantimonas sp. YJH-8]|uniref:prepilin-type N-terminal cleavage/methylation domain-containing protein n=1 Tax=Celerinatantimonas sp. YJH-8 TaxID=3228714 RepID=UPI0038C26FFA